MSMLAFQLLLTLKSLKIWRKKMFISKKNILNIFVYFFPMWSCHPCPSISSQWDVTCQGCIYPLPVELTVLQDLEVKWYCKICLSSCFINHSRFLSASVGRLKYFSYLYFKLAGVFLLLKKLVFYSFKIFHNGLRHLMVKNLVLIL